MRDTVLKSAENKSAQVISIAYQNGVRLAVKEPKIRGFA